MKSQNPLTTRQLSVLAFIRSHIDDLGYPPSRTEIRKAMRFKSPNAVTYQLDALVRKGAIEVDAGIARGIRVN